MILRKTGHLPDSDASIPGNRRVTPINTSHAEFPQDTVEYHNWQGGGGFGDPLDRDPQLVQVDVEEGAVTGAEAERVYGVTVRDGEVDAEATDKRRAAIRRERLSTALIEISSRGREPDWALFTDAEATGIVEYAGGVIFDFAEDRASCSVCGTRLAGARDDFLSGCLVAETPVAEAGPVRGQDYDTSDILLRRFYCPGCGRQLEAQVTLADGPRPFFRLAGIRSTKEAVE